MGQNIELTVLGGCSAGNGKEVRRDHFASGKLKVSLSLLCFRCWNEVLENC